MENRANYVLVGIFTVLVLLASFGFVYWTANVSDRDQRTTLLVRIEGSVSGLSQGSQVLFNGLGVGTVTNLRIDPNNPRVVIATTQIDRTTPVTTSTTASLGSQGLTGISFIGLSGGNVNDRNIIASAAEQGAVPVIVANPSDVTDILATARDIAERANNILGQFESIVQAVGPAVLTTAQNVSATSENVQTFTASLAANADQIDDFLGSLGRLSESANNVAQRLPPILDQVGNFVGALDVASVNQSIGNVAAITQAVRDETGDIVAAIDSITSTAQSFGGVGQTINQSLPSVQAFLGRLGPLSETATSVASRLDTTLADVGEITAAVDPAQIRQTVDGVSGFASALNAQSERVGSVVAGADTALATLNGTLTGLNGTRERVDEIIGGLREGLPSVQTFLGRLGPLSETATSVASRLDTSLTDVNQITAAVDPARLRQTVDGVSNFASALDAQSDRVGSVVAGADTALATLNGALSGLNGTRARVDEILAGIDPADVGEAVNNVSSATTNIAAAADSVRGVADDIGRRREDIDQFISNARDTSENLRVASAQVQGVIRSVDGLVNSPDGQGLTTEARATLQSIRETAETIQRSVGPITANIQNFSGQGLQEVRNLIRTTTEAVRRVETAIVDLTNDPSRVLFGGSGGGTGQVREFDGRVRR